MSIRETEVLIRVRISNQWLDGDTSKLQNNARSFDFAKQMKDLVDIYCREADLIRLLISCT